MIPTVFRGRNLRGLVFEQIKRTDENGNEFAFSGVCHEIVAPERMIRTFEFEGLPEKGHVSLKTATFEEFQGGRTKIKIQSVFKTVAARDVMIQSGMEGGLNEGYARLDAILADKLATGKTA